MSKFDDWCRLFAVGVLGGVAGVLIASAAFYYKLVWRLIVPADAFCLPYLHYLTELALCGLRRLIFPCSMSGPSNHFRISTPGLNLHSLFQFDLDQVYGKIEGCSIYSQILATPGVSLLWNQSSLRNKTQHHFSESCDCTVVSPQSQEFWFDS
jgi:hypothetical protein